MLSIGKLGAGQETYYLEKVADGAEDYYAGEGEAAGRWMGDAAAELGLSGAVGADQLTGMLTGHDPASGEPLGMRAVGGRGPVPGFDLTFSAPKSVSLLWGLGGPVAGVEVNAAHRAAVDAALATCSARRAGRAAAPAARSSSKARASSPPPSITAPRETATPSCTPTSWSPTRRRVRTAAGRASTTRPSTSTRRPPAISTRPSCDAS